MLNFLKQLFCKHDYKLVQSQNISDELKRVYAGKFAYLCTKCGKKQWEVYHEK